MCDCSFDVLAYVYACIAVVFSRLALCVRLEPITSSFVFFSRGGGKKRLDDCKIRAQKICVYCARCDANDCRNELRRHFDFTLVDHTRALHNHSERLGEANRW